MNDVIEKYVSFMEEVAKNDQYGYDQKFRWGEKNDFDCSSLTITALEYVGISAKKSGATYTGNIKNVLLKLGFEDVIRSVDIITGKGLQRGDILLRENAHVAVFTGNNKLVQASINEKGTTTGGKPGDQTGREINISAYRNYQKNGWNCVLRLKKQNQESNSNSKSESNSDLIKQKEFIVNDKRMKLDTIFIDNRNYVSLQSLKEANLMNVDYDKSNKIAVLSNK